MADMVSNRGVPSNRSDDSDALSASDLEKERTYEQIESGPEFRELERSKTRFIVPATIFFLVYYFALPVLVGFFGTNSDGTQGFMDTRVAPGISIAYLFALSQFIMAWILAFIYLLAFAPKIDKMVSNIARLIANLGSSKGGR
ncbi:MAG TPA: DUF485 domain-containing protein [Chloroflexia bacterium]|nr:DUF485 domain-containing protein [Chloroflexia bacterium]